MREKLNKLKKHWTRIWLITVSIVATFVISQGAYTGLKSVKRVVTTKANPGELFSSNCMRTTLANRRINTSEYSITVCNYEQNAPNEPNPNNITYNLTAKIKAYYNGSYYTMAELENQLSATAYQEYVDLLAARTYTIAKTEDNNVAVSSITTITFNASNNYQTTFSSETLPKEVSSADKFKVKFDSAELSNVTPDFYIYVEAIPSDTSSISELYCLMCAVEGTTDVASWRGSLKESNNSSVDYDFYNYIMSGSGIGTLTVMWDPKWFEINPYFKGINEDTDLGLAISEATTISDGSEYDGWTKIVLRVDSTKKNRYELQLYKVKENKAYVDTDAAAKYITCSFTQS